MKPIQFFSTYIDPKAEGGVANVLRSTFISEGKINQQFELALAEYIGNPNVFTVNSGTSALHLGLVLSGVGQDDEVILPAQTFIASGLAILNAQAKPVFADIKPESGNLDPDSVERAITSKTKAIMAVHWGGHPADLQALRSICDHHGLSLIEDAAHALGATYNNRKIGRHGDFVCFSFQAIKHVSSGDGGAVFCRDATAAEHGKRLRWFGIDRSRDQSNELGERQYSLDHTGFKYHLNDMAAALGLTNLEGLDERLQIIRSIAKRYKRTIEETNGISTLEMNLANDAFWLFGTTVENRMEFIRSMKANEIPVSVVHQGIHKHPVFKAQDQSLKRQRWFDAHQIHLPIHAQMEMEQVEYVCEKIKAGW